MAKTVAFLSEREDEERSPDYSRRTDRRLLLLLLSTFTALLSSPLGCMDIITLKFILSASRQHEPSRTVSLALVPVKSQELCSGECLCEALRDHI